MTFDKKELFEQTKLRWPAAIELRSSVVNGKTVSAIQKLNDLYWNIEQSIDPNDHWHQIAIWVFHQGFMAHARKVLGKGDGDIVSPEVVKLEVFDKNLRDNLEESSWVKERAEYWAAEKE